jgi:hypothetical protein
LAEIAIEAGLLSKADVIRAGRLAEKNHQPLIAVFVRELGVDELALVAAIRRQTRVPLVDPADVRPDTDAMRYLPRDASKRLRVLPLAVNSESSGARVLRVAMADPTDDSAIAELEQLTGCEIEITALPLSAIEELVEKGYRGFSTAVVRQRRPGDSLTGPIHLVPPEPGPLELKLEALCQLLVAKKILSAEELAEVMKPVASKSDGVPESKPDRGEEGGEDDR